MVETYKNEDGYIGVLLYDGQPWTEMFDAELYPEARFDKRVVELWCASCNLDFRFIDFQELTDYFREIGYIGVYPDDLEIEWKNLHVDWVKPGKPFCIVLTEDGEECVQTENMFVLE